MKKIFLLLALMPFLAFASFDFEYNGNTYTCERVRRIVYTSFGVTQNPTHSDCIFPSSSDEIVSYFYGNTFGLCFMFKENQTSLICPSSPPSFVLGSGGKATITNSVAVVSNGVSFVTSPLVFPSMTPLYWLPVSLYRNGYRGSGFKDIFEVLASRPTSSSYVCLNVDYPSLFSDILSSTNSVYRQILLSGLSSISSGVSSLVNFNDQIAENTADIASYANSIDTTLYRWNSLLHSVSNSSSSIDRDMDTLIDRVGDVLEKVSSDPFVNDFTNAVNALLSSGKISQVQANSFLSSYSSLSSSTSKAVFALSLKDSINASQFAKDFISTAASPDLSGDLLLIGQYLGADVVDALIGDYSDSPTRGAKAVNTRTSIKAQLRSWREEAKKQLQDWQDELRQQLFDWRISDEMGYLNVRGGIDNVTSNQFRYFDNHSPDSSINYGVNNLSNAVDRIVSDSISSLSNSFHDFQTALFDGKNPLSVKISFPLRYFDDAEVNVHDQTLADAIINGYINMADLQNAFMDALGSSTVSAYVTNPFDLTPWLEEWHRWVGDVDTFYDLAQSFYDFKDIWVTNALPFFSDYQYSFLVEDGNFYKLAFDTVRNSSHSNTLSRLCFYGLSQEPSQGNFFNLFTSFALLQSEIASSFLDARDMIDNLASSSSWFDGLSVFSAGKHVVESIPSKSQLEHMVVTATDGTNLVLSSSADLLDSFGYMTNLHSSAFSVFDSSSSSFPDNIVLFRFKTSLVDSGSSFRDVSIPVGTVPNLWLVIRLSIAFGICAVNMILFPKFLLKLVLLFMPLFKKSLPFLNASS